MALLKGWLWVIVRWSFRSTMTWLRFPLLLVTMMWWDGFLLGVFSFDPSFSTDRMLSGYCGGFRAVVGTSSCSLSMLLSLLTICNWCIFLVGDMLSLHEHPNFTWIIILMNVLFFYDVTSSKFACGFFRRAILKFKLLTCNYNPRLGTIFDIDFSHRTGALGLAKSSRSGGAM